MDYRLCFEAYKKNLFEANPLDSFDVYIQSWNPDLQNDLVGMYQPVGFVFDTNSTFSNRLHAWASRSLLNELFRRPLRIVRLLLSGGLGRHYRETYAGISSVLAVTRAIGLIPKKERCRYDRVIIARPDVVLFEPIRLSSYLPGFIYCNEYGDRMGDFRWTLGPQDLEYFADLLRSIGVGNYHEVHSWIRDYFDTVARGRYVSGSILAGRDEEVLRKIVEGSPLHTRITRGTLI